MSYLGSWKINDNLTFTVVTHTPATGAVTDADSPPTYRVYEDETGAAILNGSMTKLDDANTTGHYSEQIALSAGNGLEKGKSYNIYIEATVGGIAGATTKSFQIEAEVDANIVSDKTGYALAVTPPTAVQNRQEMDNNSTQLTAIKAKTDNLPEVNQKNVAFTNPFQFFMEDASGDGVPSLTVTGIKYLDGVASVISTAITEISNGWYKMQPAQADTNADHVSYQFSGTGAKDSIVEFWTTA